MIDIYPSVLLWAVISIQILGLFSALLSRLADGSPGEGRCQWFFLFSLALMGTTTLFSMWIGPGAWLTCGATLSIMVVVALYDCGSPEEAVV